MSFNWRPSMACDFSELANWMGVASAVMAMVSVVAAESQGTGVPTSRVSCAARTIPFSVMLLKPVTVIDSEYSPGVRFRNRKIPELSVVTARTAPVSSIGQR